MAPNMGAIFMAKYAQHHRPQSPKRRRPETQEHRRYKSCLSANKSTAGMLLIEKRRDGLQCEFIICFGML